MKPTIKDKIKGLFIISKKQKIYEIKDLNNNKLITNCFSKKELRETFDKLDKQNKYEIIIKKIEV